MGRDNILGLPGPLKSMGITTPARKINNFDGGSRRQAFRLAGVTLNFLRREISAPAMRPVETFL